MPELILHANNGTRILIEKGVLNAPQEYRQKKSKDTEAGGILIGEYRGEDLRIVSATLPGILDKRSRIRFKRRSPHHNTAAISAWSASKHIQTFTGDWHTHPEDHPTPSGLDLSEWQKKMPKRPMLLMIIGRVSSWYGLWDGKTIVKVTTL
ncbi:MULTISPECIES: Mov34/MPN/PAD-1 family protein [unclassified Pseudoalteromonas]|uniref:Mov34/MPN/PAD-1 family protein n=1 Tax=unclassified Pseudoalteromonas TaxID=194690 RepID=UPI00069409F8|nr:MULTISPECIES: Mov34/MPN/PAD-1 family protein [unclassified Pseudoalteromonas]